MRCVVTTVRGIRTPIINEGDDIVKIVIDSLLETQKQENFEFHDKDVIAVTESIIARAQGNYAIVEQIASVVREKLVESIQNKDKNLVGNMSLF